MKPDVPFKCPRSRRLSNGRRKRFASVSINAPHAFPAAADSSRTENTAEKGAGRTMRADWKFGRAARNRFKSGGRGTGLGIRAGLRKNRAHSSNSGTDLLPARRDKNFRPADAFWLCYLVSLQQAHRGGDCFMDMGCERSSNCLNFERPASCSKIVRFGGSNGSKLARSEFFAACDASEVFEVGMLRQAHAARFER